MRKNQWQVVKYRKQSRGVVLSASAGFPGEWVWEVFSANGYEHGIRRSLAAAQAAADETARRIRKTRKVKRP